MVGFLVGPASQGCWGLIGKKILMTELKTKLNPPPAAASMDTWKTESNPAKQTMLTWAIIVVGLILAYSFRDFDASEFTNSLAGFLLGILLLLIGLPGTFMVGKETTTVDRKGRRILIDSTSRFGKKSRSISFNEIVEVFVSELGATSDGSVSYYVTLRLVSGETCPLFFPAYYDGRWDRSVAEDRCRRLEEYLGK